MLVNPDHGIQRHVDVMRRQNIRRPGGIDEIIEGKGSC